MTLLLVAAAVFAVACALAAIIGIGELRHGHGRDDS
jgi:hypothetical protein